MKLSTIFSNAADFYLWSGQELQNESESTFSCISIKQAVHAMHISREQKKILKYAAIDYAVEVAEKNSVAVWFDSESASARQSQRYIWLKFLSIHAKDQGV